MDYQPMVHILFDDKTVKSVPLDISKDVVSDVHKQKRVQKDDRISAFVDTLTEDVEISLSYQSNMRKHMEVNCVPEDVCQVILEEMV